MGEASKGGIAFRMLADDVIPFDATVIDAGITPDELPWFLTRLDSSEPKVRIAAKKVQ